MDSWQRIPNNGGKASPPRPGGGLPAPGSVVAASVEEELGEGMYALRWAGQRIAVSSRVRLAAGQRLLLRSETSPEGKPTLVVQGPAPEAGRVAGRIIYGPGNPGTGSHQVQERLPGGGQTGLAPAGVPPGGAVAAGVVRAGAVQTASPLPPVGLVLEPLPDFEPNAAMLLEAAEAEKIRLQGTPAQAEKASPAQLASPAPAPSAGSAASAVMAGEEAPASPPPFLPASPPSNRTQAGISSEVAAPAPLPAPERSAAEAPATPSTPSVGPEAVLRDALARMVGAAQLPLGSAGADATSLGVGTAVPDAVTDKAAAILLRAAGLEPEGEALAAARALVAANVAVDRETVLAMVALAAGRDAGEQEALYRAAARLAARDVPLAPALVAGSAEVMRRQAGTHELLMRTVEALATDPELPEARPLAQAARELVHLLHVDLDGAAPAEALERYLSTLGREALGTALALVERAAQAVLQNDPRLQLIDQALTAVLTALEGQIQEWHAANSGTMIGEGGIPAENTRPAPPATEAPLQPVEEGAAPIPSEPGDVPVPARPRPPTRTAINAYLNAPKAVPIQELLKNLPPMPTLARLDAVQTPQSAVPLPVPGKVPAPPAAPFPAPSPAANAVLSVLDTLFQIPGLDGPEFEVIKRSGLLERFLAAADANNPAVKTEAEALFRRLASDTPAHVKQALEEIPNKDPDVLRATAARLSRAEAEILRSDPVLSRLADAAGGLREVGRQILAVKAENLAGMEREPGVMLAEVPFRLNDDAGDGRMQMFYRRGKKGQGNWTSRVILDLNTTRMGPVLGDMRFFGQDMAVTMFVEAAPTAAYLEKSLDDLVQGLHDKGFRVKARVLVLPVPSQKRPDEVRNSGEEPPEAVAEGADGGKKGILDVRG